MTMVNLFAKITKFHEKY